MKSKQPKIDIPYTNGHKILIFISVILTFLSFGLALYYYSDLPDKIPKHFNLKGEADSYGPRGSIFIVPYVALITVLPMIYISKVPHTYNYNIKITAENAVREYTLAKSMIIQMSLAISIILFYVTSLIIYSSSNTHSPLENWDIVIILGIIFLPIFLYFKKRREISKA